MTFITVYGWICMGLCMMVIVKPGSMSTSLWGVESSEEIHQRYHTVGVTLWLFWNSAFKVNAIRLINPSEYS